MRSCAEYADQFAHMLGTGPNPMSPPHMAAPPMGFDPKLYAGAPNFAPYMQQQQPPQQQPAAVARNGKRKAGEVDDAVEDGGKKKRGPVKKPKDPNAPKRPASSYLYFQNEIRQQLKQELPNITQPEFLARISKKWAELTPAEKEVSVHCAAFSCDGCAHLVLTATSAASHCRSIRGSRRLLRLNMRLIKPPTRLTTMRHPIIRRRAPSFQPRLHQLRPLQSP